MQLPEQSSSPPAAADEQQRLRALRAANLLDTAPEEGFDRLTRLAARVLRVPVALVSLVDADRQFFKSCVGLPEPWASRRQTPLTHSFCQHVVTSAEPLVVDDARQHPLLRENLALRELGVIAYAGIPLVTRDGHILGSFCAIDTAPRQWSEQDIQTLADLAASAMAEIELRRSEEHYRSTVELSPQVPWTADADGNITDFSQRWLDLTGLTRAQAMGSGWTHVPHPDDLPRVTEAWTRSIRTGERYDIEHRTRLADGTYRWMRSRAFPRRDAEGRIVRWYGTTEDIHDRKRTEEVLRRSEARYRTLFETIDEGFCVFEMLTGPDGAFVDYRWIETNPAFERHTGLANAVGRTARELVPGLEAHWVEIYGRVAATGEPERFVQGSAAMGRWFDVYAFRVDAPQDRRVALLFSDITQRKRAEEALAARERRFRALATASGAVLYQMSADWSEMQPLDGKALVASNDVPIRDWLQRNIPPSDHAAVRERVAHCIANKTVFDIEHRVYRPDRSIGWTHSRAVPVLDEVGDVVEWVGTAEDVTERRRAQEALREEEERFRAIADNIAQLAWMTDETGSIVWYNRRWYEYTGTTFEQMKGWGWQAVHHPDHVARVVEKISHSFRTGEVWEDTFPLRGRDGQYRWFLSRAVPIRDASGNVLRWFGTNTDVTEQNRQREELARAKEEAERASAAKSEFLATLSHELRTPLTPVLLTVSLMESHPGLPDELREDVATIRRNVELESRLIGDLLDLTRIERGKLHLDVQDVDLHLIVRSAIDICQREVSARLHVDLKAQRHLVRGDSTRLQQVFWNLINNAIKFTGEGGTITVRTRNTPEGRVRVDVIDTGAGIDPSVLPRLFTAFEQGEVRAARQQAGLGLGLAISKRLVEMHAGTITAASEGRGRGATFTVELPAVAQPLRDALVPRRRPASVTATAAVRPLHVLLVEDHEPTLRVMERLLRQIGHRVTGVTSVASATAAVSQDGFDLIISDLGLPDGSGLDLMRQVHARYAGRAIALTGYGMEEDIAASRAAGFADHLTKPVDLGHLEQAIRKVAASR